MSEDFMKGWDCLFGQILGCDFLSEEELRYLTALRKILVEKTSEEA